MYVYKHSFYVSNSSVYMTGLFSSVQENFDTVVKQFQNLLQTNNKTIEEQGQRIKDLTDINEILELELSKLRQTISIQRSQIPGLLWQYVTM